MLFDRPCATESGHLHLAHFRRIYYEDVQLIMNQYRQGRPYTDSLQRLSHKSSFTDNKNIVVELVTRAEIISDELIMRIDHKARLLRGWKIAVLRKHIDQPCDHLSDVWISKILLHRWRYPLGGCSEDRKEWSYYRECATRVRVIIKHEIFSIEVQVEIVRNLGSCETPYDSKWSNHASPWVWTILVTDLDPLGWLTGLSRIGDFLT